jgi:hypothetical protein
MSAEADSVFRTEFQRRPRWQKALPWVVAAVLVGGAIAAGIIWSNTGKSNATPLTNQPAVDVSKVPATVKLAPGAQKVARLFIQTAVARKKLPEAYGLVTDQIKQGQSLKSWNSGNIAVIPYPVDSIKYAPMKVDYSYAKEAQIQVALLPKTGTGVKPQLFIMKLVKRNGKWLVDMWAPRSSPMVPNGSSNNSSG